MGVRREANARFAPLEIRTKMQKFIENVNSAVSFRLVALILANDSLFANMTLNTAQESVHFSGIMQS